MMKSVVRVGAGCLLVVIAALAWPLGVEGVQRWTSRPVRASVVDGDTLKTAEGQRLRLMGIDAPEMSQTCVSGGGVEWACGYWARVRMAAYISEAGGVVRCGFFSRDVYGRDLARCWLDDGRELGRRLLDDGLAVPMGYEPLSWVHAGLAWVYEQGIWDGSFVWPAEYRRRHRQ